MPSDSERKDWDTISTGSNWEPVNMDSLFDKMKQFETDHVKGLSQAFVGIPIFNVDELTEVPHVNQNGYCLLVGSKLWDKLKRIEKTGTLDIQQESKP